MTSEITPKAKIVLTQQTAAIVIFLKLSKLEKAAGKLQKQLEKDGFDFSDADEKLEGRWKWINSNEDSDSSEDASESSEEESTSVEEEDSESSEEEEDDDDDEDEDDFKISFKACDESEIKKEFSRNVSFSDKVCEHFLSPRKDLKAKLFYSKSELRQFKMEQQQERLEEQMAQASAAFGISLPSILPSTI